jgi:hypothetical protein
MLLIHLHAEIIPGRSGLGRTCPTSKRLLSKFPRRPWLPLRWPP